MHKTQAVGKAPAAPTTIPNMNASLTYLQQVQERFDPQSDTYMEFLRILHGFLKSFRGDIEEAVAKAKATPTEGSQDSATEATESAAEGATAPQENVAEKRNRLFTETLGKIRELFAGHDDLVQGFEAFLPEDFEKKD
ncbi:hypothetical protein BX600DRAFT_496803 [Xylariales sp. PMI_506]|nr:hypothetical protein BX600DRAFT_496803 [Xylariales sp. PMI_506]